MANLSDMHPEIVNVFNAGHFSAQKTSRLFSAIALEQAHEQVNACIKGDGGAVGLTDDPNALQCWMIVGPEVARAIGEFQEAMEPVHRITLKNLWRANTTKRMKVDKSFLSGRAKRGRCNPGVSRKYKVTCSER